MSDGGSVAAGGSERRRFVNTAAAITATGGLLFGYDTGVVFLQESTSGAAGLLATVCLGLYIASFAISLGPVFWLMISEIYPLRIRGTAMSVASIANWGSNFLVALTFPVLLAALGGASSFWLFAVLGIVAWIFVYFRVPETKNRTLEEIEASFRGTTVASSRAR